MDLTVSHPTRIQLRNAKADKVRYTLRSFVPVIRVYKETPRPTSARSQGLKTFIYTLIRPEVRMNWANSFVYLLFVLSSMAAPFFERSVANRIRVLAVLRRSVTSRERERTAIGLPQIRGNGTFKARMELIEVTISSPPSNSLAFFHRIIMYDPTLATTQ